MTAAKIDFAKGNGLVPVIVQDYQTRDVLMVAYMNEEAWEKTKETGYRSCFFRQKADGDWKVVAERVFDPKEVYKKS